MIKYNKNTSNNQWCFYIVLIFIMVGTALQMELYRIVEGKWEVTLLPQNLQLMLLGSCIWFARIKILDLFETYCNLLYGSGCIFMFIGIFFSSDVVNEYFFFVSSITLIGFFYIWNKNKRYEKKVIQYFLFILPLLLLIIGHQIIPIILWIVSTIFYFLTCNKKFNINTKLVFTIILTILIVVIVGSALMGRSYYIDRLQTFFGIGENYPKLMIATALKDVTLLGHSSDWMREHIQNSFLFGLPVDTWDTNLMVLFMLLKWGAISSVILILPMLLFIYLAFNAIEDGKNIIITVLVCFTSVPWLLYLLSNLGILGFGTNIVFPMLDSNWIFTIFLIFLMCTALENEKEPDLK